MNTKPDPSATPGNKDHPEHADQKEWIGRPFDPRAFDIDELNARLNARE